MVASGGRLTICGGSARWSQVVVDGGKWPLVVAGGSNDQRYTWTVTGKIFYHNYFLNYFSFFCFMY